MRLRAVPLTLALMAVGCGSDGDGTAASSAARPADTRSGAGGSLPQGGAPAHLDRSGFTTRIDNRYWPMEPGAKWVYREMGENGRELRVEVTVTNRTKMVDGVRARVVRDVVALEGRLIEETDDWYAQDRAGNVWYLGERTREYRDGKVETTEGSWQSGVDGAQAGVVMPARPAPGLRYRQEHYAGHAEDRCEVIGIDQQAVVPSGRFSRVLVTEDTNALDRGAQEHKYYALGVGPVLTVSKGGHREELMSFHRPGG
jgi:hypothetical protein